MSRVDRVMRLSALLESGEATTVEALAQRLGVSPRTLRRDLATLREQGLHVTGESGPGGGVRLDRAGGARVNLALGEIVILWLSTQLARAATELPWSSAASTALAKLLASVPRERAHQLRALCRRVVVGPPASAAVAASTEAPPPEFLRLFEQAFTAGLAIAFDYRDREGRLTRRQVEPHGLLVQTPVWYVLARDLDRGAPRMFRVDRLRRPALLRQRAFQPDPTVVWSLLPPEFAWQPLVGARPS